MTAMPSRGEREEALAREILLLSRNTLLVNLRFLDMALSQFELVPVEKYTLMTDGGHIFFRPRHVLQSYKRGREIPVRDYLHMVMHCVFRHMFTTSSLDRPYWNLACDIAVENAITGLGLKAVEAPRAVEQEKYLRTIQNKLTFITAEKVYAYLQETYPSPDRLAGLQAAFEADDHEAWYMKGEEREALLPSGGGSGDDGEGDDDKSDADGDGGGDGDSPEESASDEFRSNMAQVWENISQRMQVDMETFGKERGDRAGAVVQNLREVNRERYDYTEFLKKFAVMGEAMRVNDDEFDYIFYTYGLQLYKKMPLIEPLEYKEVKAIKEFVIAIDTSGSTSGELVQKFVQKTYNILKSTESFFTKINLHILQCDTEIQEDRKITCQEEFDEYLKTMEIRGLGGTDFRPVFEYVDTLRRAGEFTNLKGLIYFTDGYGTFPSRKPEYETAFAFVVEDAYNIPSVPPWAIKLVLQPEEI